MVNLVISDEVSGVMKERGIIAEDVSAVIEKAEAGGNRLEDLNNGHFLGEARLENASVYVEYTVSDGAYSVIDTYSHRVTMKEDEEEE
jgi:hypothetical protein